MNRTSVVSVIGIVIVCSSIISGCASQKPQGCEDQRRIAIKQSWRKYEEVTGHLVQSPDWRLRAASWAQAECRIGKPVAQFYP